MIRTVCKSQIQLKAHRENNASVEAAAAATLIASLVICAIKKSLCSFTGLHSESSEGGRPGRQLTNEWRN